MATDRQQTAGLRLLRRALDALDVTLPDAVKSAHEQHDTITDGLGTLPSPNKASAIATALADGRDPTEDPAVLQAVVAEGLAIHGLQQAVIGVATGRVQMVYGDNVDDLIDVLRGPFDRAADDLTSAHEVLGDVDLDDTDLIVRRGAAAAEAWSGATAAAATIGVVTDAWGQLYAFVRGSHANPRYRMLAHVNIPPAAFLDAGLDRPNAAKVDVWTAVCNGWPLDLAGFDGHKQRRAAIAQEVQDRKDAAEEAKRPHSYLR